MTSQANTHWFSQLLLTNGEAKEDVSQKALANRVYGLYSIIWMRTYILWWDDHYMSLRQISRC